MTEPVSIVLVGLGGYGEVYLAGLLDARDDTRFRLVGAVDPEPERCSRLEKLRERRVPIYASLAECYRTARAELVVISSPIHRHCSQTCLALSHGSNVLCEKPAAATVQDVDRMVAARDVAGARVAIGYQWSFSTGIQELKRDIRAGVFGRPRRLKSLCLWPRSEDYYRRNDWAGRLRDDAGEWVLDSPVNNAMAHDLHNMLYLLGERVDTSASPVDVVAELYRANKIENCDTVALRAHVDGGAEVLFYGSHAVAADFGPVFAFELSRATIEYAGGEADIVARCADGAVKRYASPVRDSQITKLWTSVAAIAGRGEIPCGLEAARAQTVCMNGAHDSAGTPMVFPTSRVRVEGNSPTRLTWVDGLAEELRRCWEAGRLPGEAGLSWARTGKAVDLRGYQYYPGGSPQAL